MGKAWEHWLCWAGLRRAWPGLGLVGRTQGQAEGPALMLRKRTMEWLGG